MLIAIFLYVSRRPEVSEFFVALMQAYNSPVAMKSVERMWVNTSHTSYKIIDITKPPQRTTNFLYVSRRPEVSEFFPALGQAYNSPVAMKSV